MFGAVLVHKGLITEAQLNEALEHQNQARIALGRIAFQKGFLSLDQVVAILELQRSERDARFGELAVRRGYLSEAQRDELLALQGETRVPLGQILMELGHLDPEVANELLQEYETLMDGGVD